jgi:hypothetical protein
LLPWWRPGYNAGVAPALKAIRHKTPTFGRHYRPAMVSTSAGVFMRRHSLSWMHGSGGVPWKCCFQENKGHGIPMEFQFGPYAPLRAAIFSPSFTYFLHVSKVGNS